MDVLAAMRAAVRRWYVAAPLLLVTVIAAAYSFLHSASAWQTSGTLLILSPLAPTTTTFTDNGGTRLQAALLADNLNSDVVQAELEAKGATGAFEAKASNELPLVSVAVEGSSAEVAASTLKIVLDNGNAVLAALQRRIGTREADFYRSARSVEDSAPTFAASSRLTGAIGIGVSGTAMTILLSAVIDGLLTRRRQDDPAAGETESREHPLPVDTPGEARPRHALNGRAPTITSQPETSELTPEPSPEPSTEASPEGRNGTQGTGQQSR